MAPGQQADHGSFDHAVLTDHDLLDLEQGLFQEASWIGDLGHIDG